jgi:hypothetical protein
VPFPATSLGCEDICRSHASLRALLTLSSLQIDVKEIFVHLFTISWVLHCVRRSHRHFLHRYRLRLQLLSSIALLYIQIKTKSPDSLFDVDYGRNASKPRSKSSEFSHRQSSSYSTPFLLLSTASVAKTRIKHGFKDIYK